MYHSNMIIDSNCLRIGDIYILEVPVELYLLSSILRNIHVPEGYVVRRLDLYGGFLWQIFEWLSTCVKRLSGGIPCRVTCVSATTKGTTVVSS